MLSTVRSYFKNHNKDYFLIIVCNLIVYTVPFSFLIPSLDYLALELRNKPNDFYNYATVASVVMMVPFLFTGVMGYVLTKLDNRKVVNVCLSLLLFLSLLTLVLPKQFNILAGYFLIVCILLQMIGLALYRRIFVLLKEQIKSYQSDSVIFGGLLGVINFKLSSYLFGAFGINAILLVFMLLVVLLCHLSCKISNVAEPKSQNIANSKHSLLKGDGFVALVNKERSFIKFVLIVLLATFALAPAMLLLTTLTYANGFSTSTYSTILSLSSAMSVMAGLLMKAKPLQTANNIQMYVKLLIITGLFFCAYSLIRQQTTLIVVSLLFNFVNSMALIFMTTIINQHIAFSSGLLRFYALVEGGIITVFYLINISANFVVNLLLKIDVAYQLLYLINGGLLIISSIVIYLCFSKRSQSFPRSIINRENY